MNLPSLQKIDIDEKKVLVRADLDFELDDTQNLRYQSLVPTLDFLLGKASKIILMGKKGAPKGKYDENLSLKGYSKLFEKWNAEVLENLRFDPREEANNEEFAKELAEKGDVYINESFAVSHREHASIVSVPKYLPHAAGLHFVKEVENLSRVFQEPKKPVIVVISGIKQNKITYIDGFKKFADKILIGGRLPEYIHDASPLRKDPKVIVAGLIQDREDITIHSIEAFETEIKNAGTIVVSGPLGKFEDEGHRQGTKRVFEAVANSDAFKVVGGGDSEEAVSLLGLREKFDWLSVGGGAMLEFLTSGTLPGIQALLH